MQITLKGRCIPWENYQTHLIARTSNPRSEKDSFFVISKFNKIEYWKEGLAINFCEPLFAYDFLLKGGKKDCKSLEVTWFLFIWERIDGELWEHQKSTQKI